VKWQADDFAEHVEDVVFLFKALLKLNEFVPEGVCQEVLAAALRAALKEPKFRVRKLTQWMGVGGGERKVEANMLQEGAHVLGWQSWLHEDNVWAAAVRIKAGSSRNQSRRVEVLM
jgi:hypothetical protein